MHTWATWATWVVALLSVRIRELDENSRIVGYGQYLINMGLLDSKGFGQVQ